MCSAAKNTRAPLMTAATPVAYHGRIVLQKDMLHIVRTIFLWRGLRASLRAPDLYGFYLALGITMMICVQAFVNMSVVLGLLPNKGIPLPFLSYGGSSFLVMIAAVGILLNVSQQSS